MGGFYGSVQLRTGDRPRVLAAAGAVAAERGIKCLVGPAIRGWIGVYPEGSGQDETVGQQIAERVGGYAIHLLVHDDDILAYWLWSDGKLLDRYHSSPGYFDEENRAEEEPLVGDPKQFAFVLDAAAQAKLAKLIGRNAKEAFEVERLRRLGRVLGIENVLTSYEYLKEADGSPVKGRRDFVELPIDDSAAALAATEKATRATNSKKIQDDRKRLISSKVLLAHFENTAFVAGACPVVGGFIRFAKLHNWEHPASLEFYSSPWKEPQLVGFDLPPRSDPHHFIADLAGRRVAAHIDHAIRIWDWDGTVARHVVDISSERYGGVVQFSADGSSIAACERNESDGKARLRVIDIDSQQAVVTLDGENVRDAALSPEGRFIAFAAGTLDWTDLSDARSRRRFHIGGLQPGPAAPTAAAKIYAGQLAAAVMDEFTATQNETVELRTMKIRGKPLTPEQIEQAKRFMDSSLAQMRKQRLDIQEGRFPAEPPRPVEQALCVGFTRDGRWLWCGTNKGIRVFETAAFRDGTTQLPPPVWNAGAPGSPNHPEYAYVQSALQEVGDGGIVFAGVGAHIMRLDLETGAVRSLLQVPGATSIDRLVMSPDGCLLGVSSTNDHQNMRVRTCSFDIWDYGRLAR